MMQISLHHQHIELLPEKAAFWQENQTLILSDLHLGKAATFQKAGIAVPEGVMIEDIKRLMVLVKEKQAKRCIIVGDLIHSKIGVTPAVIDLFSQCLKQMACSVDLVLGNHDTSLIKFLPADWDLTVHTDHLLIAPFYFCHFPITHPEYFVWAGHIHPKIALKSGHDRLVLPCFQLSKQRGILPAFSEFVGGAYVQRQPKERFFVTTGKQVIEV